MPPLSRGIGRLRPSVPGRSLVTRTSTRGAHSRNELFKISTEVQDALATGKPVVALETTIYTHGFPYPENVALSAHLESLVRVNGGIPATIGILNGVAHVGMQAEELLELVSTAGNQDTWKISRRDLAFIGGLGLQGHKFNGGTTIAGTMILAHLAGIKIFATGGLGGVHRGGENSLDISADLTELGRTPVTVISSGCKSFLDIPRTLEYLETQGVGVGTFADGRDGQVDFPAFYSRDSGVRSPRVIADEAQAAAIVYAQSRYPLQSGLLFANPVPEEAGLSKDEMDVIISKALIEADQAGMHGAANTPYVLKRIKELSNGGSVGANRALISANVVRGTKVAVELAKLELEEKGILERSKTSSITTPLPISCVKLDTPSVPKISSLQQKRGDESSQKPVDIVVAGSLASDLICDYAPLDSRKGVTSPSLHTSNPAVITQSPGGVGFNVARAAHYAGASVVLASVVANDITGTSLIDAAASIGMTTSGIQRLDDVSTAQYVAINDTRKDLTLAMADMSILSSPVLESFDHWDSAILMHKPKWVVVDANWSPPILSAIIAAAKANKAAVAFEPVSNEKGARLFHRNTKAIVGEDVVPNNKINITTPNVFELKAMYNTARDAGLFESARWWDIINRLALSSGGSRDKLTLMTNAELVDEGVPQQSIQLLPYLPNIVTKLGAQGCLLTSLLRPGDPRLSSPEAAPFVLARAEDRDGLLGGVYMRLYPPAEVVQQGDVVSVNGVGDTMLGVLMAGLVGGAKGLEEVIPIAQQAAVFTLKSREAVSPEVEGFARHLK